MFRFILGGGLLGHMSKSKKLKEDTLKELKLQNKISLMSEEEKRALSEELKKSEVKQSKTQLSLPVLIVWCVFFGLIFVLMGGN